MAIGTGEVEFDEVGRESAGMGRHAHARRIADGARPDGALRGRPPGRDFVEHATMMEMITGMCRAGRGRIDMV